MNTSFPCPYCKTVAKSPQGLRRHVGHAHPGRELKGIDSPTKFHPTNDNIAQLLPQPRTRGNSRLAPPAPGVNPTSRRDRYGRVVEYQQTRLYRAEGAIPGHRPGNWAIQGRVPTLTKQEIEAIVDQVGKVLIRFGCSNPSIQEAVSATQVKMVSGRGGAACHYGKRNGLVTFSPGARSKVIVLHEMAHRVINDLGIHLPYLGIETRKLDRAGHGWEFCRFYLALIKEFQGDAVARTFSNSMYDLKVLH